MFVTISAAALGAMMIAACSGSSSGSSSPSGASAPSGSASSASGDPVGFMMITAAGPGNPGYDAIPGAQAAVAEVNSSGGVRGHPVKLTVCDTHGNQNQAAACAQQALSTPSILATVGDDDYSGG